MIRSLFIIAGAALVLCLVTVGGALAIGGHDLQRHGWAWTFKDDNGETVRFERVKGGGADDLGPFTTRTLAWTGGETLTVDSSVDVEYIQGDANSVVVTGPKALADRVQIEDGRIRQQGEPGEVIRAYHHALLVEKDDVHRFSASAVSE